MKNENTVSKFKSRTSWRAKLEKPHDRKYVKLEGKSAKQWGDGMMLIAHPMDIDAAMRMVPEGRLTTIHYIREKLAKEFGVDCTCPLTSGIFARIAAEAAEEDRSNGREDITPYWRVIREDGSMQPKFPGGPKAQAEHLEAEGFSLIPNKTGTKVRVKDFKEFLFKF